MVLNDGDVMSSNAWIYAEQVRRDLKKQMDVLVDRYVNNMLDVEDTEVMIETDKKTRYEDYLIFLGAID